MFILDDTNCTLSYALSTVIKMTKNWGTLASETPSERIYSLGIPDLDVGESDHSG